MHGTYSFATPPSISNPLHPPTSQLLLELELPSSPARPRPSFPLARAPGLDTMSSLDLSAAFGDDLDDIMDVVDVVDVDVVGRSSSVEDDDDVTMEIGEPLPLYSGGSSHQLHRPPSVRLRTMHKRPRSIKDLQELAGGFYPTNNSAAAFAPALGGMSPRLATPHTALYSSQGSSNAYASAAARAAQQKPPKPARNVQPAALKKRRKDGGLTAQEKKKLHNAAEKRRQQKIKVQVEEIKQLVESVSGQQIARGRAHVLAATFELLKQLTDEREMLRRAKNTLEAQVRSIRKSPPVPPQRPTSFSSAGVPPMAPVPVAPVLQSSQASGGAVQHSYQRPSSMPRGMSAGDIGTRGDPIQQAMMMRRLAVSSSECFIELDQNLTILHMSEGCRAVTGHVPQELVGKRFHDIAHPSDLRTIQSHFRGLFMLAHRPGESNTAIRPVASQPIRYRRKKSGGGYVQVEAACHSLGTQVHRSTRRSSAAGSSVSLVISERVSNLRLLGSGGRKNRTSSIGLSAARSFGTLAPGHRRHGSQ